jgi:hypothetical protein
VGASTDDFFHLRRCTIIASRNVDEAQCQVLVAISFYREMPVSRVQRLRDRSPGHF